MMASKPRIIRLNDLFSTIAPNCPKCGKADKIRTEDSGASWYFVCDRCKYALSYDEAIKGQKEVEQ